MELSDSENVVIESRTKRIRKKLWSIFVLVIFIVQSNAAHIDFEDAEESWLKDVTVHYLPLRMIQNKTTPLLKVSGLATDDIEDGVRIKATLSGSNCMGNESDLQIINDAPSKNSINRTTDLIVSIENFEFQRQSTAYLCIKTKYDHGFQHMGERSKFSK